MQCPQCQQEMLNGQTPHCPHCRKAQQDKLRSLHSLDTRIVAGVAGFLLALVWLTLRNGAWDWLLLAIPTSLLLFALLPRKS